MRQFRRAPRRGLPKPGLVYFIQVGGETGPIKIGHTVDLSERLKTIQTASPAEAVVIGTMKFETPDEARGFEQRLHNEVFWDLRMRGEWFRCDPRILRFVRTISMVVEEYEGTDRDFDLGIRSISEHGEDLR